MVLAHRNDCECQQSGSVVWGCVPAYWWAGHQRPSAPYQPTHTHTYTHIHIHTHTHILIDTQKKIHTTLYNISFSTSSRHSFKRECKAKEGKIVLHSSFQAEWILIRGRGLLKPSPTNLLNQGCMQNFFKLNYTTWE